MIQLNSRLKSADNSGAKKLRVLGIHSRSNQRFARIGDIVTCSVLNALPDSSVASSQIVKAIIVRTKKETRRDDGSYVRFDDNAAVVLDSIKNKLPLGTRIFGPVAREIKELGYNKIVSLAPEVL